MRKKLKSKNGKIIKLYAREGNQPRYTFRLSVMKYRYMWSCILRILLHLKKKDILTDITACMDLKIN